MCSDTGLLAYGKKHELVERIVEHNQSNEEQVAHLNEGDLYNGKMESIPNTTAGLMRLSVAQLRAILRTHNILELGTKEELVARVGLLKGGYPEAAFSRERLCILYTIEVAKKIRTTQEGLNRQTIRRKRKYAHGNENTVTTRTSCLKDMLTPKSPVIKVENNQRSVENALDPLKVVIVNEEEMTRQKIDDLQNNTVKSSDKKRRATEVSSKREKMAKTEQTADIRKRPERERKLPSKFRDTGDAQIKYNFSVGQTVEVLWNEKELEGTDWKPGWYKGEIQRFDEENDAIYIFYFKDRAVYSLDTTGALVDGIIRST